MCCARCDANGRSAEPAAKQVNVGRVRGPTHSKIRTVLQSRDFKLTYKKIRSRASATEYIRLIPVKQMKQVHFLGPRVLQ